MTRWIDSKSERDQSTSNLPVLPPAVPKKSAIPPKPAVPANAPVPMAIPLEETEVSLEEPRTIPSPATTTEITGSETAITRRRTVLSNAPAVKKTPAVKDALAVEKSVRPKRQGAGNAARANPGPPTRRAAFAIQTDPGDATDGSHDSNSFQLKQGIPSWLVSFIVHIALLLVLAILTTGVAKGPDIIGLEMADSEKEIDVVLVETDLDLSAPTELDLTTSLPEDPQDDLQLDAQTDLSQETLDDMREIMNDITQGGGTSSELVQIARGDGKSVRFFGAGAKGTKFVFVIDCSGSMGDEGRWYTATRELKSAISSLRPEQKYYVFLYNSLTYNMTRHKPRLKPATQKNQDACIEWLESHLPVGDTRPLLAMQAALDLRPDAIFFLSDGELKDNTARYLKTANRDSSEYDQIPIHTIFLGRGFGRRLMEGLAKQNGGSFTHVRN